MKVWLIQEGEYAEYNEAYCARLFEQEKAVPAGKMTMDSGKGRYWLRILKAGMERAEKQKRQKTN